MKSNLLLPTVVSLVCCCCVACGVPVLSDLRENRANLYLRYRQIAADEKPAVVEVELTYDARDEGSCFVFNNISAFLDGTSLEKTSGGGWHPFDFKTHFDEHCEFPKFALPFEEVPTSGEGVVTITDGRSTIRMIVTATAFS